ncbi:MAG TPA: nucleoside monophosphate kinase [Acidimicrobiia bacterium]|nr:nucleoside monophosphate kinase [Acidimicrobiia bacterium]
MVTSERPRAESSVGIVLVAGPPGSGKGTQCARLAEQHGWGHLSSGEHFRDLIARRTPLGLKLQSLVDAGGLVPDDLTVEIVLRALDEMAYELVLLDGFPRTLPQAHALIERSTHHVVRRVVELSVPTRVSFERLAERARSDDDVSAIRLRLALYESQTRPAIEWFSGLGIVVTIDGNQPPPDVGDAIASALADLDVLDGIAAAPSPSSSSSSGAATV